MINVLDIETYENENNVIPYCICFNINEKIYTLYNTENIIVDWLNIIVNDNSEKKIDFYIHNLNFDGIIILKYLGINRIKFEIISNKTNVYSIKIFYCNFYIVLKCSYKIIPMSLRTLGVVEGQKKKYFPYKFVNKKNLNYIGEIPSEKYWEIGEYEKFFKENKNNLFDLKKITIDYCVNDVILTNKIIKNIFDIVDLEDKSLKKKCLSAPSMSHKLFYKKYNFFDIKEKLNTKDESFIRSSYFGGRCEVFGNAKETEHIKYFDFSGMYGQCMLENFHIGDGEYKKNTCINDIGFYNIDYESKNMEVPVLPAHYNNKLMFMNGTGSGTFWYEEIKLFVEMGGIIKKINSCIVYDQSDNIFKKFIEKFEIYKKNGGYYKIFGKLMINSLYGSMALKDTNDFQYITFSEKEFYNMYINTNVKNFYKIGDCYVLIIVYDYKSKKFAKDKNLLNLKETKRNVSYAASISSKARIKLYKAMINVIKDGGRLLYCDTDSIFAAYDKNDIRKKCYDIEWIEFYNESFFIAPKTYGLKNYEGEIIKIKGINFKNITFDEIKNNFVDKKNIIFDKQLNFRKFDFNLKQFYIQKNISVNSYDKRIFIDNKRRTVPITINR